METTIEKETTPPKPESVAGEDSLDRLVRLRLAMWAEGWTSEDQLTTNGWGSGLGYSIWFNRWDWHGQKLAAFRATYHAHGLASDGILRVAEKAAALAREAWQKFPDEPPNQMAHYVLQSPGDYVLANVASDLSRHE